MSQLPVAYVLGYQSVQLEKQANPFTALPKITGMAGKAMGIGSGGMAGAAGAAASPKPAGMPATAVPKTPAATRPAMPNKLPTGMPGVMGGAARVYNAVRPYAPSANTMQNMLNGANDMSLMPIPRPLMPNNGQQLPY